MNNHHCSHKMVSDQSVAGLQNQTESGMDRLIIFRILCELRLGSPGRQGMAHFQMSVKCFDCNNLRKCSLHSSMPWTSSDLLAKLHLHLHTVLQDRGAPARLPSSCQISDEDLLSYNRENIPRLKQSAPAIPKERLVQPHRHHYHPAQDLPSNPHLQG